jgi:hypothetical protein
MCVSILKVLISAVSCTDNLCSPHDVCVCVYIVMECLKAGTVESDRKLIC